MSRAAFAKDALRRGETVQIKPRGHSGGCRGGDGHHRASLGTDKCDLVERYWVLKTYQI